MATSAAPRLAAPSSSAAAFKRALGRARRSASRARLERDLARAEKDATETKLVVARAEVDRLKAELADAHRQLHEAREVIDDLVRTRRREGREADEALSSVAASLAEAQRRAEPRPRQTIITVEGDVVSIRERAG